MTRGTLHFPDVAFERLPDHRRVAEKALQLLAEDDRVLGLYLAGSFAHGHPDLYSDIDIYCLVSDADREVAEREHEQFRVSVAPIITEFPATHLGDPHQFIVFYEASIPVHVDYQYRISEELVPRAKDKHVLIVLDRTGELGAWKRRSGDLPDEVAPTVDDLQYLEDRFWGWCWYAYGKIARGELWEARDAVEYIRTHVLVRLGHHLHALRPEGNRQLEFKLDTRLLGILRRTIPPNHTTASYCDALRQIIDGYTQLFQETERKYRLDRVRKAKRELIIQAVESTSRGKV